MEFILRRDICKEFLDKYNKEIYPELLSRIIEIGILTLKLSFNRLIFAPEELDEMILSLHEQYKREKKDLSFYKLKKLTNKYFNPIKNTNELEQKNLLNSTYSFSNKSYDNYFINNTNFYDSNYYIPESKSFRNKQLYNKRLKNPLFTTQNKNVYPFWWWNFPDEEDPEIENNDLDTDSIYKSQIKSFKNQSSSKNSECDEEKIFQKDNCNIGNLYNYDFNENNGWNFNETNKNNFKISYRK